MIQEKQFGEGRLPSEPSLAKLLGVSRGTIRQAMEQLSKSGLLVRKHGAGTYVNQQVLNIQTRLEEVYDFVEMIHASGHSASVVHKGLELGAPETNAAKALRLGAEDEAITTSNVFLADNVPVIYCVDVIPAHLVKHAYLSEELHGPVYTFLENRCAQRVSYNITEVRPTAADKNLSQLLACLAGSSLHLFIEIGFNSDNQPIIFSEEYYRPEFFSFKVVRKMIPSSSG